MRFGRSRTLLKFQEVLQSSDMLRTSSGKIKDMEANPAGENSSIIHIYKSVPFYPLI